MLILLGSLQVLKDDRGLRCGALCDSSDRFKAIECEMCGRPVQYHPKPRYCYSCAIMSVTEKELLSWALIETYGGYQSTTEEANITERLRREARMGIQ